jgi:hypothetical protein
MLSYQHTNPPALVTLMSGDSITSRTVLIAAIILYQPRLIRKVMPLLGICSPSYMPLDVTIN